MRIEWQYTTAHMKNVVDIRLGKRTNILERISEKHENGRNEDLCIDVDTNKNHFFERLK